LDRLFGVEDFQAVDFGCGLEQLFLIDQSSLQRQLTEASLGGAHFLVEGVQLCVIEKAQVEEFLAELTGVGVDVSEAVAGG